MATNFKTAEATISGYELMHMIRKGQVEGVGKKDASAQNRGAVWDNRLIAEREKGGKQTPFPWRIGFLRQKGFFAQPLEMVNVHPYD